MGKPGLARKRSAARPAVRRRGNGCGVRRCCARCCQPRRRDPKTTPGPPSTSAWPNGPYRPAVWAWPGCSGRSRSLSEERAGCSHLRATNQALGQSHFGRLARRPDRRAPAGSPSAPAWPMRHPPCSLRRSPRRPLHPGDVACSAFSPTSDPREASRSPSPSLRATIRSRCSPRRSMCWPATATTTERRGLLDLYPKAPPSLRGRMRDVLLGRLASARAFLERVDSKAIAATEVPVDQLRQVALHGDPKLDALVRKHWGSIQPGTAGRETGRNPPLEQRPPRRSGRPRTRQGVVRASTAQPATSCSARGVRSVPT